jgi:drug/metabolite transporter (DMT)-like permease
MDKTKNSTFSPVLGLVFGILAVSSASLLIRFAQKEASSLVIAAFRMVLAAVIVAPFCWGSFNEEVKKIRKKTIFLLALSGTFLALHFVFWITSLEYTSVASSVVLVTTAPLWVALLSPVFLKEKITRWVLIGLIVSLTGSVIVGLSSGCSFNYSVLSCEDLAMTFHGRMFVGDLMALAGAFLSAGYLMIGRKVRSEVSLSSYIFSVYSTSAVILLLLVWVTGAKISGFSGQIYLWLFALAIVPQVIGHSVFNWALKYLSAIYVSIALLGEPIGTVMLTMIFLHESPSIMELAGGLFILTGIVLATRNETSNNNLNENKVL